MPQRGILWVGILAKGYLRSVGTLCANARACTKRSYGTLFQFKFIFYPQNVPTEQKILTGMESKFYILKTATFKI